MKKSNTVVLVVVFVAVLLVAAFIFPKITNTYELGQSSSENPVNSTESVESSALKATDFTVFDSDGNSYSLSDFTGKPTVVNFWATWCGYCVKELPDFNTLYEEYKDEVNFMMVDLPDGFNETKEGAMEFIEKEGYTFPVYFDSEGSASDSYQIRGIPMSVFVDKDGNLYEVHTGAMSESTLRDYIDKLTE